MTYLSTTGLHVRRRWASAHNICIIMVGWHVWLGDGMQSYRRVLQWPGKSENMLHPPIPADPGMDVSTGLPTGLPIGLPSDLRAVDGGGRIAVQALSRVNLARALLLQGQAGRAVEVLFENQNKSRSSREHWRQQMLYTAVRHDWDPWGEPVCTPAHHPILQLHPGLAALPPTDLLRGQAWFFGGLAFNQLGPEDWGNARRGMNMGSLLSHDNVIMLLGTGAWCKAVS